MKFTLVYFLIIFFIFFSCKKENCIAVKENGKKIFYNKSYSANKNLNIRLNLLYSINGAENFSYPAMIDVDRNNNLYVLDNRKMKIARFDSLGKYLNSFGSLGNGPGEFTLPNTITISEDSIYISDGKTNKISVFNLNLEFLYAKNINSGLPSFIQSFRKMFVGYNISPSQKNNKMFFNFGIGLYDKNFKLLKNIANNYIEYNPKKPFYKQELEIPFAVSSKYLAIGNLSSSKYEIAIYDSTQKNNVTIKKVYATHFYQDFEKEKLLEYSKTNKKVPFTSKFKEKNAINYLGIDKFNRLWVRTPTNSNDLKTECSFDIYTDYIFQNNIKITLPLENKFDLVGNVFLKRGRLYVINKAENKVYVYSYN